MAEKPQKRITVETYDRTYKLRPEQFQEALGVGVKRWDWILESEALYAHEYYNKSIKPFSEFLLDAEHLKEGSFLSFPRYIDPFGEMGEFILSTKNIHGEKVAIYLMEIASSNPKDVHGISFSKSESLTKMTSYEYLLANYLFFQYTKAADYILDNTSGNLKELTEEFKRQAKSTIENIDIASNTANQLVDGIHREFNQSSVRLVAQHKKRVRRYRKAFKTVREEASTAREKALDDLNNAHGALLAKLDIEASVTYWDSKAEQYKRSSWRWLALVIITAALTFGMPVVYYLCGGISSLAANSHHRITQVTPSPSSATENNSEKKSTNTIPATDTIEKVAFASGIADLTGAALIVTLMSVILRLFLRQFNTRTYLHHDAEERVTMIKTYLALASEGKLTAEGDMKLVLDTLFRASQTTAIPDQSPATPIELIVKAITEKR